MTLKRMDNVSIVVEDIKTMIAFLQEIGMTLVGETRVSGDWVDRIIALKGSVSDVAVLETPDGHNRIELAQFVSPAAVRGEPKDAPANMLGLRRIMFTVVGIDDYVSRLQAKGATLMGEVVQYEDTYRLCYMRGPEGLMFALAEEL